MGFAGLACWIDGWGYGYTVDFLFLSVGLFYTELWIVLAIGGCFALWVFVVIIWAGCLCLLADALFNDWLFIGLVCVCYLWFRLGLLGFYAGFVAYFDLVLLFSIQFFFNFITF